MRLYIANAAPSYIPATWKAAFKSTSNAVNVAFSKTKAGVSATVAATETSTTNNYKAALVQAVSAPLGAGGTLGGAFTITMARQQSATAASMSIFFRVWVTVGDTDEVRGTFYADFVGATKFATTMTTLSFGLTGTNVAVQPGDRVVFEYGFNAVNTSATAYTGTVRYGGTAGDLATSGTTGVTTDSPWVDFAASNDSLFVDYVPPVALGQMQDYTFQSYTGTAKTSQYHLYAAGRDTTAPMGLVVHLDGDGGGEFPNPTTGYLAQYNTVALGRNMVMLSPLAPDTVGSRTWWEDQASPVWLLELFDTIITAYPQIDKTRIWFMGYSGGAEVQTYWLLSDYSNRIYGGGNIMLGGGGAAGLVFGQQPTAAFKTTQRLHWAVGEFDTNDGTGFNAYAVSQKAYDRYGTEGFTRRSREVIPGKDHFTSEGEGPRVLSEQLALAYDTVTPVMTGTGAGAVTFTASGTGKRTPKGNASGTVSLVAAAAGKETPKGTGAGTVSLTGTATGKRAPKGNASGTVSLVAAAAGKETPKGTGAGTVSLTGTATGKRAPKAVASGVVQFTGTSTGARTTKGTAAGSVTFTGTATGKRSPKSSAAGVVTFTGNASGKRTPTAGASGTVTLTGAAAGSAPTIGTKQGTAAGSLTLTGTGVGKATRKGTGAGALQLTGMAQGKRAPRGAAADTVTFTGAAAGKEPAKGTATGTVQFTGSATGVAPVVGGRTGTGAGTLTLTGSAVGKRVARGTSAATVTLTGTAQGKRTPKATATGHITWIATATGTKPVVQSAAGVAAGVLTFTGNAAGTTTRKGYTVGGVQFTGTTQGTNQTGVDVTVTATLEPQRWVAALTSSERSATLAPRRWEAHL